MLFENSRVKLGLQPAPVGIGGWAKLEFVSSITNPRTKSSGLAERTLKNLRFIEQAHLNDADVHVVTQVVNSLLALLIFPVEAEINFFEPLKSMSLPCAHHPSSSQIAQILTTVNKTVAIPSLQVNMFANCPEMATFFRRVRNALSHKNIDFDSDSLVLSQVTVTLKDRKNEKKPFEWEIRMTAQDFRNLGVWIGSEVVSKGL